MLFSSDFNHSLVHNLSKKHMMQLTFSMIV